jgi:hypothetical protein
MTVTVSREGNQELLAFERVLHFLYGKKVNNPNPVLWSEIAPSSAPIRSNRRTFTP